MQGFKITWGPNGGYEDVVDGCSIRGKENAFLIPPKGCIKGHTTPEWVPGANGKATCTCTDWQPCMCRAAAASGWGSVFLLTSAIISMGYVGLGLLHGQRQGRESDGAGPAALLAMHPHITQWRSVGGLVADGLAFTVSRGTAKGSRGAGYSPLKATASSGHGHVAAPDSPKHKSKKKKSSGKSEKKQEGAADGAVGSETGGGGAPTVQAPTFPPPASAGAEAAATGTAAGDVSFTSLLHRLGPAVSACFAPGLSAAANIATLRAHCAREDAGYTCRAEWLTGALGAAGCALRLCRTVSSVACVQKPTSWFSIEFTRARGRKWGAPLYPSLPSHSTGLAR